MSKTRLVTIGMTLAALALVYRIPQARQALTGESGGFFG